MTDFLDKAEEQELFRQKGRDNSLLMFNTSGSAGSNPTKLAQICIGIELLVSIMGWQSRPLANFTKFLTQYQASIDGEYHKDFKDVQIAEEIEKRRAERKGISILQS